MQELFGSWFDFNQDGEQNNRERATELTFWTTTMDAAAGDKKTELEMSGLDADELGFMDAEKRREALEEAGLNPDAYDF